MGCALHRWKWLNDFKQQKFRAFRPTYLPGGSAIIFAVLGVFLIVIGLCVLYTTNSNAEIVVEYSGKYCMYNKSLSCDDLVIQYGLQCNCTVNFTVDSTLKGNVLAFYGLENFYQNNRWYFQSRNDAQLGGKVKNIINANENCKPYSCVNETSDTCNGPIVPCGATANSLFNDSFVLDRLTESGPKEIHMETETGIVERYALSNKYKNPKNVSILHQHKPLYWSQHMYKKFLDKGFRYEPFVVWMQPAALPKFRKRFGTLMMNNKSKLDKLPLGNYSLKVLYRYPVSAFGGKKRFILATASWMGPKRHLFLPLSYIVLGSILIVLSAVFGVLHFFGPAKTLRRGSVRSYGATTPPNLD